MRIGVLTGGGDCPGLNAVIRAIVRKGIDTHGHEFFGFRYGWAGVINNEGVELTLDSTRGILHRGGTILGSSRTNVYKVEDGLNKVKASMKAQGLDALIPIGGEDTLGVAGKLHEDGIPVVGVPKTIDNDLAATDFTFGFQTAVQIATDAIDRLHTTAESHNRVIVCEVMGRHAGWIAVYSGMAGGADVILIPERPFDIDEVVDHLKRRHARGATFSIVVVAEGATPKDGGLLTAYETKDAFGHVRLGGIGMSSSARSRRRPASSPARRSSATSSAAARRSRSTACSARASASQAVDAVTEGNYGKMTALRGTSIEMVPLAEALAEPKLVDSELYETAEVFFG